MTIQLTPETLAETATPALLQFYNEHAAKPIKAFKNRTQALERVGALLLELQDAPTPEDTPDPQADAAAIQDAAETPAADAWPFEVTEPDPDPVFPEDTPADAPAPSLLGALVNQITDPTPAPTPEAPKTDETDPNQVTLAALCTELKVVPRIARRRLRKALGKLDQDQETRWTWTKDSEALATARRVISGGK